MNASFSAPENFNVVPGDCSAEISWEPIKGAAGYKLQIFRASDPDNAIKTFRIGNCLKTVRDLINGENYLASVCAVSNLGKVEFRGESTSKILFVPISEHLKAQNIICLSTGESANIKWEYRNRIPRAEFASANDSIATVSDSGTVTAVSKGVTYVTIKAMGEEFTTKISVDREMTIEKGKAVMLFAGDIMCTARHQQLAEKYSYDFNCSFEAIKKTISSADYAVGILGTSCCDVNAYESELAKLPNGAVNRNSPSSFLSAVANAGFDGVITASNNCLTSGKKGLMSTVSAINSVGMKNIGTLGANPAFINVRGIRTAIITASSVDLTDAMPNLNDDRRILIGQFSRESMANAVRTARSKGAEYVIVCRTRTSESTEILENMSEEAQFIADSGADLIIGTYPSGVRRYRIITSADGRKVPCAFSLGCFLCCGSQSGKTGIILRAALSRDSSGKISADISYIPCRSEDRPYGAQVIPAYPYCSEEAKKALAGLSETLGKDIGIYGRKPRVFINGSLILDKIFSSNRRFRIDKAGLLISPLSVCGTPDYDFSEKDGGNASADICKTIPKRIEETKPDFAAVDFYTAAGLSSYKLRDNFFTGTKNFTKSTFYILNKDNIERLRPPLDESVWKPRIKEYAQMLMQFFPSERIVLFRHRFPGKALRDGMIRSTGAPVWLNNSISAMEEYFMGIVSPSVIDISDGYFTAGKQYSDFEKEYFADAYNAFCKVALNGYRYVYTSETELRFNRLLERYDSVSERGHFDWLLKFESASDKIIAYTSKHFAAENAERLIRLKKLGRSDLSCVRDFFDGDICAEPIVKAAELIDAVLSGDLTKPYEFYEPAFRGNFNILKKMATLLSDEIGQPVDEQDAELVFVLRGKAQMQKYISGIAETTVDIWGCSISRESLKLADNAHYGNEISYQPQILAFDGPVLTQFPEDLRLFNGSARKRMYLMNSLLRNGIETVENSRSKWLLLDLYELINSMADYDGELFEIDEATTRTSFYKSIKDECEICSIMDKIETEKCIEKLDRFAAEMLAKYEDNIILIRSEPKPSKVETEEEKALRERRKSFLKLCEENFIAGTHCYVINIADRFNSVEHVDSGLSGTVRYETAFYRQCGRFINEIMRGTEQKVFTSVDENYILLRNIKSKWNRK